MIRYQCCAPAPLEESSLEAAFVRDALLKPLSAHPSMCARLLPHVPLAAVVQCMLLESGRRLMR